MAAQTPLPRDLIFSSPSSSSSPAPVAGAGEYLLQLLQNRPAPLPSAAYAVPESAVAPGPVADEEDVPYAHLALQHDPAVAAMGPCHSQRHLLLQDLQPERGFLQHQQNQQHPQHHQHHQHHHHHHHHQHQHHQHQHLHQHQHQHEHKPHHHQQHQGFPGMSSPQFPERYLDSFMDPLLGRPTPSVEQDQFFGSYQYRLVDHKSHVQMPPPGFGPSGLMKSNRKQELNPSLVPHSSSESLENVNKNLPQPPFSQSGQHVVPGFSMGVENRRSYSQTSSLEQHDALVNKYMHAFMNVQDAKPPAVPPERSLHQQEQQSRVAPPRQPDLHAYEIGSVQNGATMPVASHQNSSDLLNSKEFLDNGRKMQWKQKHIQVAQDSNEFNRNSVPDWIAISQDKKHEDSEGGMPRLLGMREEIPSKCNHDGEKQRGQTVERRSKHTHVLSLQSKEQNEHNSRSRIKSSMQDSRVGLPSGTGGGIRVDSITDFATDTLKKALHNSLPTGDEGMANADKTILGCLKFLDLNDDNAADKHIQHLPISKVMRPPGRVMMLQKFNQRELPTRFDSEKCTKQFLSIIETLIPPIDEEVRRKKLLAKLKELVSGIWPDAQLYLFGSCANAFAVCNSDIDICLSIETEDSNKAKVVRKLAEVLEENEMQNVQALTHARVPIVKYSDPETGMSCDVCVNNMLAVENTKLLHDYAQIDARLRQLAFLVKHWAKCRQVNETYRGTLSSYAYVLMCIHFLQQRKPPVLPCLQGMEPTFQKTVGDIECAYFDRVESLKDFGHKNKESLADLVASFFEYWAFGHDYRRSVISIRTGRFLSKMEKDWTRRIGNERHLICIEDPFEISHDLGRVVDKYSIHSLKEEFLRAARIMQNDEDPWLTLFKRQDVEEGIQ